MKPRHTTPRPGASGKSRKGLSRQREQKQSPSKLPTLTNPQAVQVFEPDPTCVYSIETTAQIAGVPRRTILIYCKHHLISCAENPEVLGYWFTADTLRTLRQIEWLRARCRDELNSVATILQLLNEISDLRAELRSRNS